MSKDELIAKQQLEIEKYKIQEKRNKELKRSLHYKFYAIGAPLNDNILQFNKEQHKWCFEVIGLIEEIDTVKQKEDIDE